MGTHAILSPSAAARWLRCTPSARLEERMADEGSQYALEGTVAHAVCARLIKQAYRRSTEREDAELAEHLELIDGEMTECAQAYKALISERYAEALKRDRGAVLLIETTIDIGEWAPDCFGTVDAMIMTRDSIDVIDFKYGKGVPVKAEQNPQMMLYALGALTYYDEYDIKDVTMTIVQPRLGSISTWSTTADELRTWGKSIRAKADEAYIGIGTQVAGEWCQFCKVRSRCRALAEMALETYEQARGLTLDAYNIAELLPKVALIKAWVSTIEEESLRMALDGKQIPGYKLVHGRSVRRIADEDAVAFALKLANYDPWKPQELKSLTEMEKAVGKKRFAELCGEYIIKPEGKPTLVPESDKRPAIGASDFDGFELND